MVEKSLAASPGKTSTGCPSPLGALFRSGIDINQAPSSHEARISKAVRSGEGGLYAYFRREVLFAGPWTSGSDEPVLFAIHDQVLMRNEELRMKNEELRMRNEELRVKNLIRPRYLMLFRKYSILMARLSINSQFSILHSSFFILNSSFNLCGVVCGFGCW